MANPLIVEKPKPSVFTVPDTASISTNPPQGSIEGVITELVPVAREINSAVREQTQSLTESFSTGGLEGISEAIAPLTGLAEKIDSIPTLIAESVGELVMTHAITGNINFEFNNDIIEGSLGPVVLQVLQDQLAKPMVLEALARSLKGYISPSVFLNNN